MGMAGRQRSRYRQAQDRVRSFNKRVLNPFTLRFAGRPFSPYGVVRHVGRRSGRRYDTPVVVREVGDRFVIPLPYGADTDWYRNVRAADECVVVRDGHAYRATSPRLVDPSAVPEAFPSEVHRVIERAGAEQYLRLDRGEQLPAEYHDVTRQHPVGPVAAGVAGAALLAALAWRARR